MHLAAHDPAAELSIHGVEKTDETGRLCRLVAVRKDLAVRGLEGEIKQGGNVNSHYDHPHDATDRFNFVLANPPFNVNAVDTAMRVSARRYPEGTPQDLPERQDRERLKDMVGPGRRFPFGLSRTDNARRQRRRQALGRGLSESHPIA
jgi:type I restriction enzyme M protein